MLCKMVYMWSGRVPVQSTLQLQNTNKWNRGSRGSGDPVFGAGRDYPPPEGGNRVSPQKFGGVHNMQWTFFWLTYLLTYLLTYYGAYFSPPHHRDRPTHTFLDSLVTVLHVWLVPIIRTISAKNFYLTTKVFFRILRTLFHRDRPTRTFLDPLAVAGHVWLVPIIRTVSAKNFCLTTIATKLISRHHITEIG